MRALSWLALVLVLALSAAAGVYATRLQFDTSTEVWFLENDPDLVAYRAFLERFGSDRLVALAWEDPQLWTPEGLAFLGRVTEAAAELPGVLEVASLTNVRAVHAEPGLLLLEPLIDFEDLGDPRELRRRVLADPLLAGRLVSEDGLVPAVVLTYGVERNTNRETLLRARSLRDLAKQLGEPRGLELHAAGTPLIDDAFLRFTRRDLFLTFPTIVLVIMVVVLVLFRTWRALPLPIAVVLLASLWVAGLMSATGIRMTVIHGAIFPMLLGMGIANSMHILSRATLYRSQGQGPREAGIGALRRLVVPSMLTALTSAGGLLSLLTAELKPLRQMGALGAAGIVSAFFLTYALGPFLLPLLPAPAGEGRAAVAWQRWDAVLRKLARWVFGHARAVIAVAVVVLVVALIGLPRMKMGINILDYFKRSAEVRQEIGWVDEHLGSTLELEILIETGKLDGMRDPAVLERVLQVQRFLDGRAGVSGSLSLVDWLAELRRLAHGGDESERRLPESRAEVAQLLLLLDDPSLLEPYADFDFATGRVAARIQGTRIPELMVSLDPLDPMLRELFPAPESASSTGLVKLVRNMESYLLTSQLRSLGTAILTVLLLMAVALRSLRLGVLAMIPNLVPIGVVLGLMAWVGIPLDPGTSMTAAVAIGLVVDDTVHFLHLLRERLLAGDSVEDAAEATLVGAGRAAAMSAVILTCAFAVLATASFKPNIYFGLLSGITVLLAACAELLLLPAVLALVPERVLRSGSLKPTP